MIRVLLLLPVMWGSGSLALAEWHYARGMASPSIQDSIDHLTSAGEVYPYEFKFRTAQASQLFLLTERRPGFAPAAIESLRRAVEVDPSSPEMVSKLLYVQRMVVDCDGAKSTADRLRRLVPLSERAKSLIARPCRGPYE